MESNENPNTASIPVITQISYPNVRLHVTGDKLYVMWDVFKPGIMSKLDHVAYLVSRNGKFVEEHCKEGSTVDSAVQPLMTLGSTFRPRVDSVVSNIVNNLLANNPNLQPYAAWQIDYAHRQWSQSGDYPNEEMVIQYIPGDTAEAKFEYLGMQMGDKNRAIAELEKYISKLTTERNQLNGTIADLQTELGMVKAHLEMAEDLNK